VCTVCVCVCLCIGTLFNKPCLNSKDHAEEVVLRDGQTVTCLLLACLPAAMTVFPRSQVILERMVPREKSGDKLLVVTRACYNGSSFI
jgi:hypothetical protein